MKAEEKRFAIPCQKCNKSEAAMSVGYKAINNPAMVAVALLCVPCARNGVGLVDIDKMTAIK